MIATPQDYPAVIPYLTCGWPDPKSFLDIVDGVAAAGCPFFEVGFPFSDPIADGPVIQETSTEALNAGVSLDLCFELTRKAHERTGLKAACMTYANLIFYPSLESFCSRLAKAGGAGLIVPDLSFEESPPVAKACAKFGLELISFLAPTSDRRRREEIASKAKGFLYLVAVRGITGGTTQITEELSDLIADAKSAAKVPVLVGFGIRGKEQVAELKKSGADGVIVGTALIEALQQARRRGGDLKEATRSFLRPMVEAAKAL